jgi:hypothetical protein
LPATRGCGPGIVVVVVDAHIAEGPSKKSVNAAEFIPKNNNQCQSLTLGSGDVADAQIALQHGGVQEGPRSDQGTATLQPDVFIRSSCRQKFGSEDQNSKGQVSWESGNMGLLRNEDPDRCCNPKPVTVDQRHAIPPEQVKDR